MQWKEGFLVVDASLALADVPSEEDSELARSISAMLGTIERKSKSGLAAKDPWRGRDMGGETQNSLTGCHPF
jgi:hypothetical protein